MTAGAVRRARARGGRRARRWAPGGRFPPRALRSACSPTPRARDLPRPRGGGTAIGGRFPPDAAASPPPTRNQRRRGPHSRRTESCPGRRGHPRPGAAPDRRGRRDRQDHRPHAAHRLSHRHAPGAPRGDPGADLHGQGGARDGGACRRAGPLRLRRRAHLDLPRVRRLAPPRARSRARAHAGLPGAEPGRAGAVPPDAALRAAARPLPAARRPHAAPPGAHGPLRARQGRGCRAGGLPGPRDGARGGGHRPPGRRRAPGPRGAHHGTGAHVRGLPGPHGARRVRRLRRPDLPGAAPPTRAPVRARPLPAAVPLRPGRRVPGHQPRPVRAGEAARGPPPERHRRRGRRPGDLPVPRRLDEQHPRVRRRVPGRPPGRARPELPLGAASPGCRPPAHQVQQSRAAGVRPRHRQAAGGGRWPGRRPGPPVVRDRHAGGRRRRAHDRGGRAGRAAGVPGLRDPRPRQRGCRPVPALAQPARDPVDVLGQPGALRPPGGAPLHRVPAGHRPAGRLRQPLRPGGVATLCGTGGRSGPLRGARGPPEPMALRRPAGPRRGPRAPRGPVGRGRPGDRTPRQGAGAVPRAGRRAGDRGAALPVPRRQRLAGSDVASQHGPRGSRGPERRALLPPDPGRDPGPPARPRARVRGPPGRADRGRGGPGGRRGGHRHPGRARPHGAQGQGTRVPGGVRRGAGPGPVPVAEPQRRPRAARRPPPGSALGRRLSPPGGAAALLRRDDAGQGVAPSDVGAGLRRPEHAEGQPVRPRGARPSAGGRAAGEGGRARGSARVRGARRGRDRGPRRRSGRTSSSS